MNERIIEFLHSEDKKLITSFFVELCESQEFFDSAKKNEFSKLSILQKIESFTYNKQYEDIRDKIIKMKINLNKN